MFVAGRKRTSGDEGPRVTATRRAVIRNTGIERKRNPSYKRWEINKTENNLKGKWQKPY